MLKVAGGEARSREERGSEYGGIRANIPTTLVRHATGLYLGQLDPRDSRETNRGRGGMETTLLSLCFCTQQPSVS